MRREIAPIVAVIGLVLAAAWILGRGVGSGGGPWIEVLEVQGDATLSGLNGIRLIQAGDRVEPSERLATGLASSAVLALGDATRIRVAAETQVKLVSTSTQEVTLELDGGRLEATVRAGAPELRIAGRDRVIAARDARFTYGIAADGTSAVEVSEGSVQNIRGSGWPATLVAGERAVALADGTAAVAPVPAELLLAVEWPSDRRTREPVTRILGFATPGSRVRVRGGREEVSTTANSEGQFQVMVALGDGQNELAVEAVDPLGRVAKVRAASIELDRAGPNFHGRTGAP